MNTTEKEERKSVSSAEDTTIKVNQIDEEKDELIERKGNFLLNWFKNLTDLESDPRQFSRLKKYLILMTVALATAISPISSTIYLPALVPIQTYFHTSATTINASLSAFTFANAIFPLIWASIGELFGRRRAYLISFLIALLGSVGCALSNNIGTFIALRAIAAIGSSSVQSMGAGTIADIFDAHERGTAIAIYSCGPLLGPAVGPIVGGYLNDAWGWRSNFWFICIAIFVVWVFILVFLPETWRPAPVLPDSPPMTKKEKLKLLNPLRSLMFFKYPNIALSILFVGVIFMMFYFVNTTFTRTYTLQYGFDSGTVGLCYLPLACGGIVGSQIGGRIADSTYNKRMAAANGNVYPEMRLNLVLVGSAVFTQIVGFLLYGWSVQKNVHFSAGLVAQFILAVGLMIPLVTISTYCVDCFRKRSSSITAANNFARYIMAGIGALVATDAEEALGDGPMYSMCAGIIALAFIILVFVKKNHKRWEKYRT